jgi:hypothetical protein
VNATEAETGLEQILALDFDPQVPCCECEFQGLPPTAAVAYLVKSCGCEWSVGPFCAAHRKAIEDKTARSAFTYCVGCYASPITYHWVPIKEGS